MGRMGEIKEMVEKANPILVAVWVNEEAQVYEQELFQRWKEGPKELVMGPERETETETDAGHFVLRIYRNKHGYWLYKIWQAHFGYSWEEDQLYFLPDFKGDQQ
jgi:hypothetical protein